ncbi:Uncharacterized protein FWK35_00022007, partial [Aphis craccivora]
TDKSSPFRIVFLRGPPNPLMYSRAVLTCPLFFFFVYVSVYSITSRNTAPISNYGGSFRCKSDYPRCIIEFSKKSRKTKKKMTEKREFLRKTCSSSRPNRFFYMVVIQKLIT